MNGGGSRCERLARTAATARADRDCSVTSARSRALLAVLSVALLATLLGVLTPAGPASAAATGTGRTFVVAPAGSDTAAGSWERPWRTFTYAFRQLLPGDTLLVRGGTYRERVTSASFCPPTRAACPATSTSRIVVAAAPGERPVLRGLLWVRGADWWTFRGLTVAWDSTLDTVSDGHLVKFVDGVGWRFENGEVSGSRSFSNILVTDAAAAGPAGWVLRGNCVHGNAGDPSHGTLRDHNLYLASGLAGSGLVEDNILFDAPRGDNIKIGVGAETGNGSSHIAVRWNTLDDALTGVVVAYRSSSVRLERNLVGRVGSAATGGLGKSWYPAFRGIELTGTSNAVIANAWYASGGGLVRNTFGTNNDSTRGLPNGTGELRLADPRFDSTTSCSGFTPANASLPYGARYGRTH